MSEYVDGELSESGRSRLERHVRDCHHCRELLKNLRQMIESLRGIGFRPAEATSPKVADEVMAGFRRRNESEEGGGREPPG